MLRELVSAFSAHSTMTDLRFYFLLRNFPSFPLSQALFAHHVWNASLLLADRIATSTIPGLEMSRINERQEGEEATMSLCELGCGAGIPGLIAARSPRVKRVSYTTSLNDDLNVQGSKLTSSRPFAVVSFASQSVITDYDDPLLIDNLKANIELGYDKDEETRRKLVALGHTWGEEDSLRKVLE